MTSRFTSVEQTIDDFAHRVLARVEGGWLPSAVIEFTVFGIKQAWACLFGGLMLAMIMASALFYPEDAMLNRYDALFLGALMIQLGMIAFRLETFDEVKVILVFHVVGTAMEIFKTSVGSWVYPEEAIFRIADVPMFSGFMYAAVGSYLARVTRIFDFRFTHYPPVWATVVLAGLVYVNFFAHHYLPDIRLGLFAVVLLLFGRTRVYFRVFRFRFWMPLVVGFGLVALFIWFAENIGTLSRAWLYPNQANGWSLVSIQKLGSWYLLMIISFVLVTLVRRPQQMMPDLESKNVHGSKDGT